MPPVVTMHTFLPFKSNLPLITAANAQAPLPSTIVFSVSTNVKIPDARAGARPPGRGGPPPPPPTRGGGGGGTIAIEGEEIKREKQTNKQTKKEGKSRFVGRGRKDKRIWLVELSEKLSQYTHTQTHTHTHTLTQTQKRAVSFEIDSDGKYNAFF